MFNLEREEYVNKGNKKLKVAREVLGLTQAQVAKKAEITERMYQNYEYGVEPRVQRAIRIAKTLNTTVEKIF